MENSFETQASTSGNNLQNRSGENRQSGTKRRLQENGLPPAKYYAFCPSRYSIFLGKKGLINFPDGVMYPEIPSLLTRSKPRERCIVYVNGLHFNVTQEWIETIFGMWGPVKKILLMDKGTCYIKYFDESSAENSLCWSGFRLEIEKPNEDKYSGILCVDYAEGDFDQTHLKAFLKKNNISVPNENALEYVLSSFDEINISEPSLDEINISEPSLDEINISEPSLDEINISEPSLDEINISEPSLDEMNLSELINHLSESRDLNRETYATESLEHDFESNFCLCSELCNETKFTDVTNDLLLKMYDRQAIPPTVIISYFQCLYTHSMKFGDDIKKYEDELLNASDEEREYLILELLCTYKDAVNHLRRIVYIYILLRCKYEYWNHFTFIQKEYFISCKKTCKDLFLAVKRKMVILGVPDLEENILQDVDENNRNDQDVEDDDTENVAFDNLVTDSFDISQSEPQIIAHISLFLSNHPGESIDSIFSYLSEVNVTINIEIIENLMRRSPQLFKECVSNQGGKWYLKDLYYDTYL